MDTSLLAIALVVLAGVLLIPAGTYLYLRRTHRSAWTAPGPEAVVGNGAFRASTVRARVAGRPPPLIAAAAFTSFVLGQAAIVGGPLVLLGCLCVVPPAVLLGLPGVVSTALLFGAGVSLVRRDPAAPRRASRAAWVALAVNAWVVVFVLVVVRRVDLAGTWPAGLYGLWRAYRTIDRVDALGFWVLLFAAVSIAQALVLWAAARSLRRAAPP